jgi:hypothetical protein
MINLTRREQSKMTIDLKQRMLLDFFDIVIRFDELDESPELHDSRMEIYNNWNDNVDQYKRVYGKSVTPDEIYGHLKATTLAVQLQQEKHKDVDFSQEETLMLGESLYQMIKNKEQMLEKFSKDMTVH